MKITDLCQYSVRQLYEELQDDVVYDVFFKDGGQAYITSPRDNVEITDVERHFSNRPVEKIASKGRIKQDMSFMNGPGYRGPEEKDINDYKHQQDRIENKTHHRSDPWIKKFEEEEDLNELSVDTLRSYNTKSRDVNPMKDKFKTAKHVNGHHKAEDRIALKTGDRGNSHAFPKNNDYSARLEEMVNELVSEDNDAFTGILNKQHKEQEKKNNALQTKDEKYGKWLIRYQISKNNKVPAKWQVMHQNKDGIVANGVGNNSSDALNQAKQWIEKSGTENQNFTGNKITVDFNVAFTNEFMPHPGKFYAAIDNDNGPILILSLEPQAGLKQSAMRNQKEKVGSNTNIMYSISMSTKEAQSAGLGVHGRYVLGPKEDLGDGLIVFKLLYQGKTEHKTDTLRMNEPGLTLAHDRTNG